MKYLLWIGEKGEGPFDKPQIVEMLLSGKITGQTLWLPEEGKGDWQPVNTIPGLLHVGSPQPPAAVAQGTDVKESGVALVLKLLAGLEIVAAAVAGFSEGVIGGSGDAQRGWLIFMVGALGGLILVGFACVIDHSYECAQRLRRIEDMLQKANAGKKPN